MKKYIWAYPVLFIFTVFFSILAQATATASAFFTMFLIDSISQGSIDDLIMASYMAAGFILLFFLSLWVDIRLIILYSYKTVLKFKNDIFSSILNTKLSDFSQNNSAKYISIINNDIKELDSKYINSIISITKDISSMIFAFVAMAFLSPVNAVVALLLASAPIFMPFIFGKKLAKTSLLSMQKMSSLNEKVKDFLLGFEVIKTFNIEKNIKERFTVSSQEAQKAIYNASKASAEVGVYSGTISFAVIFITYLIAGYFVITGNLTIGAVIAISNLSSSLVGPIQFMSMHLANIKSTKEIRKKLLYIMEGNKLQIERKKVDTISDIKLVNLSFDYINYKDNDDENLSDINLLRTLKEQGLEHIDSEKVKVDFVKNKPDEEQTKEAKSENISPDQSLADILASQGLEGIDLSKAKVMTFKSMDDIPPDLMHQIQTSNNVIGMPKEFKTDAPKNHDLPKGMALKNITYTFKQNGKYAIVGGSGSGKSTLLKIIMGYYDEYQGSVLIENQEIRDISRESLYSHISIMHQGVFMLDDTFRSNITLYNNYSDKQYKDVIKSARLESVIDALPQGSDTKIGEGGNMLSGGERSRIAMARAFIKGSSVIILDEAMANLDNETAYKIENTLIETPNISCIFVTHRYTKDILQKCDDILVMKDGELVETGRFDELYESKGYFYSLYNVSGR